MPELSAVISSAEQLYKQKDSSALELLLGLRENAVRKNSALKDDLSLDPKYDAETMGALDDVKALGKRVLNRWNKELQEIVCGGKGAVKDRQAILQSLNLGEAAVVGAVASVLFSLGAGATIAAALAALVVKRFIWPAKDELCIAWKEKIDAQK
jgi:hypothetical protein